MRPNCQSDVAVVIPVYNRPRTVLEALQSVAAQTCPPRQLILVDDGSTDHTPQVLDRWKEQQDSAGPIRVVRQRNRGAAAARNRGAEQVENCRYVAFLDSDDLWPPDFLERAVTRLHGAPRAVAATCDEAFQWQGKSRIAFRSTADLQRDATRWLFENDGGITPATVLRADAFRAVGGYDARLPTGEDWKLYLAVSARGAWLHLPGAPVTVRVGLAALRGEEGNVTAAHADIAYQSACLLGHFVERDGGHRRLPAQVIRRGLARRWYKAGRALSKLGQLQRARACFRQSLRWRVMSPKTVYRHVETYFLRAA